MTSFWGYVTEGVLLLVLAQWWLINTCMDIMTSKQVKQAFRPKITYPWPGSNFPVEILYKLVISTFGFFAQLVYGGGSFHDEEGNFQSMPQLMYMSIYGIFWLHSLLDLLLWFRFPLIHGSHYASAATGFFWYAAALHSSAGACGPQQAVQRMMLTFPVYMLVTLSAVLVLEPLWRHGVTLPLVRAFCLQVLALWCFQSAHVLHAADAFPGSGPNPDWDPSDHRNVAYTAAFFGLHLCISLVLTVAAYTGTAAFLHMRHGVKVDNSEDLVSGYGYTSVSTSEDDGKDHLGGVETSASASAATKFLSG